VILLFLACATTAVDDGIISISGWVYEDPFIEDRSQVITTVGAMQVLDAIGEPLVVDGDALNDGIQPFDGNPGYWRWWAIPEEPYYLRIDGGEGYHPALWAGWGPPDNGFVQSLLFGFERADTDPWFQTIGEATGLNVDLDSNLVHLWGQFDPSYCRTPGDLEPETSLECPPVRDIEVRSGPEHTVNPIVGFTVDPDEGTLVLDGEGPVRYFYAFGMLPDWPVDLKVSRDEEEVIQSYGPAAGDIIAAWYFQGP
jgi:hypothetical protein